MFIFRNILMNLIFICLLPQAKSETNLEYSNEINELKEQIKILEKEKEQLKKENKEIKEKYTQIEEELNLQRKSNNQLLSLLNDIKTDKDTSDNRIRTIELEKENLQHKLDNYSISNEEFSRGLSSLFGLQHERKTKTAILYLKKSSEKGNCFASYFLGILYEYGNIIERNIPLMLYYY